MMIRVVVPAPVPVLMIPVVQAPEALVSLMALVNYLVRLVILLINSLVLFLDYFLRSLISLVLSWKCLRIP